MYSTAIDFSSYSHGYRPRLFAKGGFSRSNLSYLNSNLVLPRIVSFSQASLLYWLFQKKTLSTTHTAFYVIFMVRICVRLQGALMAYLLVLGLAVLQRSIAHPDKPGCQSTDVVSIAEEALE